VVHQCSLSNVRNSHVNQKKDLAPLFYIKGFIQLRFNSYLNWYEFESDHSQYEIKQRVLSVTWRLHIRSQGLEILTLIRENHRKKERSIPYILYKGFWTA
jgi:hypothetical protein